MGIAMNKNSAFLSIFRDLISYFMILKAINEKKNCEKNYKQNNYQIFCQ